MLREKIESKAGNRTFGAGLSVKLFASLSRVVQVRLVEGDVWAKV